MYLNRIFVKLLFIGIVLSIHSCAPAILKSLEKQELPTLSNISSPILFNNSGQANYRCKIKAFDQTITGVMIFKKEEEELRVAMITDFGLKVIDISFREDGSYTVNHIMKHMDYKFVRESFALNLGMILDKEISSKSQYFYNESKELVFDKPLLYTLKDKQLLKVERYRNGKGIVAIAEIHDNSNIDILQISPKLQLFLTPINK